MYIYLKLTEDHSSKRFLKGEIIKLPKASKDAWMATGMVEEATKKDFDKYNSDKQKDIQKKSEKAASEHYEKTKAIEDANATNAEEEIQDAEEVQDENLGNESSTDSDNGGSGASEDLLHHTLTKEDIEENTDLTEGFTEGDEIEVDENGTWMLGEDEKLIKKEVTK